MKPRELSTEECTKLLSNCRYGRLALSMSDSPYVIPMSYVFSQG
ncbi:MAG TPA: pyridoxamine 5'-phosphate oxidase family protein, partial [Methanothrix sp.]|nr:pyridoxamine 5'-phosphate oxidase family protein [Methanothrix sp.]